eukprot:CAMPEP_0172507050 /NCGR_PEP_ID=MMETSP1066-20121228/200888_1 /TAXON_ID=671091 /ORGANISM="Coscinodiscus wailesii, Strain CCMP2513" /LENGTH=432 /DNA_ID=CAMNT_0013284425 /DNA_START=18 /DNA_END=1316 /DNA_ORIENTATION=+
MDFLGKCNRPLPPKAGIEPTVLYATNKDATKVNVMNLCKLPGQPRLYVAKDWVNVEPKAPRWARKKLEEDEFFRRGTAERKIELKYGAQVMLIKNESPSDIPNRKVNGSRGKIIGFIRRSVSYDGPGYEDLNQLSKTENIPPSPGGKHDIYPIVEFMDRSRKIIRPVVFESRLVGLGFCRREAIPLKLAWAMTIHKSQGMSLDYVKVDVKGVFTEAQTYVALSRARDEKALELRNFTRDTVRVDERALAFYSNPEREFPLWYEAWDFETRVKEERVGAEKPHGKDQVVEETRDLNDGKEPGMRKERKDDDNRNGEGDQHDEARNNEEKKDEEEKTEATELNNRRGPYRVVGGSHNGKIVSVYDETSCYYKVILENGNKTKIIKRNLGPNVPKDDFDENVIDEQVFKFRSSTGVHREHDTSIELNCLVRRCFI